MVAWRGCDRPGRVGWGSCLRGGWSPKMEFTRIKDEGALEPHVRFTTRLHASTKHTCLFPIADRNMSSPLLTGSIKVSFQHQLGSYMKLLVWWNTCSAHPCLRMIPSLDILLSNNRSCTKRVAQKLRTSWETYILTCMTLCTTSCVPYEDSQSSLPVSFPSTLNDHSASREQPLTHTFDLRASCVSSVA